MQTLVKERGELGAAALLVSVVLHVALVLLGEAYARFAPEPRTLEIANSVAMVGSSIEVEAPTQEFAAAPAAEPAPTAPAAAEPAAAEPAAAEPAPTAPAGPTAVTAAPPSTTEPETERALPPPPADDTRPPRSSASSRQEPRAAEPTPPQPPARSTRETARSGTASTAAKPNDGTLTESAGAPAAGTFGQEGLPPGVRRLGYAFTRAIPAATPADGEWQELPAGTVGTVRIELAVDENNRLGELRLWQARAGEPAPPPILRRMVERTLLLLRAGQFALSGSNQPGVERLVIEVQTRDEGAEGAGDSVVVQKRFEGASPGRPGKAYFRYGTGRAVEAKVTIVPAARR